MATSTAGKESIKSVPNGATLAKMPQRMDHVKTFMMASIQTQKGWFPLLTEAKMKSGKSQGMHA